MYLSEEQCSTTNENLIGSNYEWAQTKEDNQRAGDRHCTICIVYTNLNNFFPILHIFFEIKMLVLFNRIMCTGIYSF